MVNIAGPGTVSTNRGRHSHREYPPLTRMLCQPSQVLPRRLFQRALIHHILGREMPVGSRDAARLLRMHPKTVLRKAREGTLPAHPVGRDRKRWHFYLSELDDWLRSQVIKASLVRQ